MRAPALALGLLLFAALARGEEQVDAGGQAEAYSLLNEASGARALALGSAYDAVAEDAAGMFWNPAAPALAKGVGASMSHENWLAGTDRDILSVQAPFLSWLSAGVFGTLVHYGGVELRDDSGQYQGGFEPQEQAMGLDVAVHGGGVAVGVSGRYLRQQLPGEEAVAYSGEAGLLWDVNRTARLGMVFRALPQGDGSLQGRGSAGICVHGKAQQWGWLGSSSVRLDPQAASELDLGLEGSYQSTVPVALRIGYSQDFPALSSSVSQRYSAGMGVGYEQFSIDYAYLPWGDFGATHRLSLSFHQSVAPEVPQAQAEAAATPVPTPWPIPAPVPVPVYSPAPSPAPVAASPDLGLPAAQFRVLSEGVAQARGLEAIGDLQGALKAYHAAATADAADGEAWRGMGRLYQRMGRADYAKRCWAEVLRLSPEDPEAKGFLAAP